MATVTEHPSADSYSVAWGLLDSVQFVRYARRCPPRKPLLRADGIRLFYGLADHVRAVRRGRHCPRPEAASDYMDGRCLSADAGVRELLAAGVVEEVPVAREGRWPPQQRCTWHLTPYGCAVLIAYAPADLFAGLPQ